MRGPLLLAGSLLLLTACADPPAPATGASTPVLRTVDSPGLGSPADEVAVPGFSLYGDGRALVQDGMSGALPKVVSYPLTRDRVLALFEEADDADLFEGRTHESDLVDGGALRITVRSTGGEHVTTVYGPSPEDGGARGRAVEFAAGLTPGKWPRSDLAGEPTPYRAERLAVFFLGGQPDPGAEVWPFGAVDRCVTLGGAQLAEAVRLAEAARPEKLWTDGKRTFTTRFRPLLPDENDCEAARRR